jgi:hypothetical protein
MSTKNDLLAYWCARTNEPIAEARLRLRALAVGHPPMVPWRQEPLTYRHFANALLGFVVPTMHKDAAETVRRVRALSGRLVATKEDPDLLALVGKPLADVLVAALRPPLRIISVEANITLGWVRVDVGKQMDRVAFVSAYQAALDARVRQAAAERGHDTGEAYILVSDPAAQLLPPMTYPVETTRSMSGALVEQLLRDLSPLADDENDRRRPRGNGDGARSPQSSTHQSALTLAGPMPKVASDVRGCPTPNGRSKPHAPTGQ